MTPLVPSRRYTTSSRTPGRVNAGTVWTVPSGLRRCAECGRVTSDYVLPGMHGAHWREGRQVNCAGVALEEQH